MTKITKVEIADLKDARKTLAGLQQKLSSGEGAAAYLKVLGHGEKWGDLSGNGEKIAQYVSLRTQAVTDRLTVKAVSGVQGVIAALDKTIANYEANEKKHKDAADGTPTGQSKPSGGSSGNQQGGMG